MKLKKILIVDDDVTMRAILKRILTRDPRLAVVEAHDAAQAWELLEQGEYPDLCVLDIMMPVMDGIELLEKIRNNPQYASIKVIMCSAKNDKQSVLKSLQLRVKYYLIKPFKANNVLLQVQKALGLPHQNILSVESENLNPKTN
ncbi:MAG: response regulator [Verrucomicrobia bacterium]|nr:response regulator [Verrucomicrobiota bacterium]